MTRVTFKTGMATLIILGALGVGMGCGVTKISWWPWGKNQPPGASAKNAPTQIAKNIFEPPEKSLNTTPEKNQPPTLPEDSVRDKNSVDQFKLAIGQEKLGNLKGAVRLYQKAADQGLREAEYTIGLMHATGEGLTKNDDMAVGWFRKAADKGLPQAQQWMGIFYEQGRGVELNYPKAISWYKKAAEQGYADAQYHLGYLHFKGLGVEANSTEAAKWFRKAAEQGVPDAQFQTGVYLVLGEGVEQDMVEGYKWLTIANLKNHQGAKDLIKELHDPRRFHSKAISEGAKRANEFLDPQKPKQ